MTPSAVTAVVFEESSEGTLEIKAVFLRRGRNEDRLRAVAQELLDLFQREITRQDRERLVAHNPTEYEA